MLGTRYYLSNGNLSNGNLTSGYAGSLAVSPETGDIIVVLVDNDQLPTWEFLRETVSVWDDGAGWRHIFVLSAATAATTGGLARPGRSREAGRPPLSETSPHWPGRRCRSRPPSAR